MNNFIIKKSQTKDNESFGYFNNFTSGIVKCFPSALPVFSFSAENATTDILTFNAKKINKFGKILQIVQLNESAIKLNLSENYYYYDKTIISDLDLACGLWYLEITNISNTWNSQIFEVLEIPNANFVLTNNGTDTQATQGLPYTVNYLLSTENFSELSDGSYNITLHFGSEYSVSFSGTLLSGETAILTTTYSWQNSGLQTVSFTGDAELSFQIDVQAAVVVEFLTTTASETVSYLISANLYSVVDIMYSDGTTDSYTGQGSTVNGTKSHVFTDAGTHYAYLFSQNTDLETLNPTTNNIIGFNFNGVINNGVRGLVIVSENFTNFAYCTGMAGKIYGQNYINTKLTEINNANCTQVVGDDLPQIKATNLTTLTSVILGNGEFAGTATSVTGLQLSGCSNLTSLNLGNIKFSGQPVDLKNCTSLQSVETSSQSNVYSFFRLENCTALTSARFKGNEIIKYYTGITNGFYNTNNLTSFQIDNSLTAENFAFWPTKFSSIDLSKLHITDIYVNRAQLAIINNTLLTSLLNVNGTFNYLQIYTNTLLTNITFANVILKNNCTFDIKQNALIQSVVDAALQIAVNSNATNGVFNSSGGTNAAPSAAGIANKNILVSRGWTVTVNV